MKKLTKTQILDGIMRQCPLWPSTFSSCMFGGDGQEHTSARGGGPCLYCYQRELERRIGRDGEIYDFSESLFTTYKIYHSLLKSMERAK